MCVKGFGGETWGKENHLKDPDVDGRIILKRIFKNWDWSRGLDLSGSRQRQVAGWMRQWTFGLHKTPGVYWLSERLLACQRLWPVESALDRGGFRQMRDQAALPQRRSRYTLEKLTGCPQSCSTRSWKGKSQTPPAYEPRLSGHSPLSLSTHYPS